MNKKETGKKDLAELISILVFAIWFFLLLIPYIFNFDSASRIGKIFMILGSVVFFIMFGLIVFGVEIINKKEKYKNKKSVWIGRITFLLILVFYILGILRYFNIKIDIIYSISFTAVGLIGLFSWAYSLINRFRNLVNNEKITVIILSIALFVLILGLVLLGAKSEYGSFLIKVSIGIFYIFLISAILNLTVFNSKPTIKEKYKIFLLSFFIVLSLVLLILFPFYVQWWGLSGNNFNYFVTIYSALVGGGLTLFGVAWTIKKADSDRKEEEKKKAKPLFTFDMVYQNIDSVVGKKFCFDDNLQPHSCHVLAIIENSDRSVLNMERIYHDNKWFSISANKVVLPNARTYLDFTFDDISGLFLEVADALGNTYYYEIKVLFLREASNKNHLFHTIRELREMSESEILERINQKGKKI